MGLTPQISVCMQRKYKHLQLSTRGPRMDTVQGLVPHTSCFILSATECWQNSRTLPTSLSEKMAFLYFLLLVRSPTHWNGSTQLGGTWQSWALTPDLSIRVLVREHEFEIRNSGQIDLKYYLVFQPLSSILPVDTLYFIGGKIEYPERPNTLPVFGIQCQACLTEGPFLSSASCQDSWKWGMSTIHDSRFTLELICCPLYPIAFPRWWALSPSRTILTYCLVTLVSKALIKT